MDNCCESKVCEAAVLAERQARVLKIVLAINAAMFIVEGAAGILDIDQPRRSPIAA